MEIEIIFSIIGAVSGIIGMITGVSGLINKRYVVVSQFMSAMCDKDFIAARKYVYNGGNHPLAIENEESALVINFFQYWGLLERKHYLPVWVFDTATGAGVERLYNLTKDTIALRRENNNDETYALEFELLCERIRDRRRKKERNERWRQWVFARMGTGGRRNALRESSI